jgi:hypothetical protein
MTSISQLLFDFHTRRSPSYEDAIAFSSMADAVIPAQGIGDPELSNRNFSNLRNNGWSELPPGLNYPRSAV